jgi:DNA-directed RNA polymerase I subunit RPA49
LETTKESNTLQQNTRDIGDYDKDGGLTEKRFILGIYNPETGQVDVTEAPILHFEKRIKLKNHTETNVPNGYAHRLKDYQARASLGHAFGSKKKRQELINSEKNRVNTLDISSVLNLAQETIEHNKSLVVEDEGDGIEFANKDIIPPFDKEAKTPAEVYKLLNILPPAECKELNVKPILKAKNVEELIEAVEPWKIRRDSYCFSKLSSMIQQKEQTKVRQIIYLSMMFRLYDLGKNPRAMQDPTKLATTLNAPRVLLESLLNKFAEDRSEKQDRSNWFMTSKLRDSLACYILAACLHFDVFSINVTALAKECKEPIKRYFSGTRKLIALDFLILPSFWDARRIH